MQTKIEQEEQKTHVELVNIERLAGEREPGGEEEQRAERKSEEHN